MAILLRHLHRRLYRRECSLQCGDPGKQGSVLSWTQRGQQLFHFLQHMTRAMHELNEDGPVLPNAGKPLYFDEYLVADTGIAYQKVPYIAHARHY